MRISSLEVSGFRAFGGSYRFDLDADVVVLHGPNGSGKTSLLDAIVWSITGVVSRLGDAPVMSIYSDLGYCKSVVELAESDGSRWRLQRESDGQESSVTLESSVQSWFGGEAEEKVRALCSPALHPIASASEFDAQITRTVYLEQDQIRRFLATDSPRERFEAVSVLFGSSRVVAFQVELDKQRTTWSRSLNDFESRVRSTRQSVATLEAQLEAFASRDEGHQPQEVVVADVLVSAGRLLGQQLGSVEVAASELNVARQTASRQRVMLEALSIDAVSGEGLSEMQQVVEAAALVDAVAEEELRASEHLLKDLAIEAAEAERAALRAATVSQELAQMASIAIKHLGDTCPVCTQGYDMDVTVRHLEDLQRGASDAFAEVDTARQASERGDEQHANRVQAHQDAHSRLVSARLELRLAESGAEEVRQRLRGFGLPREGQSLDVGLSEAKEAVEQRLALLDEMVRAVESAAVSQARARESNRKKTVVADLTAARQELASAEGQLMRRRRVGKAAEELHSAVTDSAEELVARRLAEMTPLLQRVFAAMDPHPTLRQVVMEARYENRRGRLLTLLHDRGVPRTTDNPVGMLSSSQLNAVAVAAFVGMNLSRGPGGLDALLLDDPAQSLDEIHLLGLVDVLRRLVGQRQLMVSAHDRRQAALLARKLRPLSPGGQMRLINFGGWSRRGPVVSEDAIRHHPERRDQRSA